MPEDGNAAVLDAVDVAQGDISTDESSQSTDSAEVDASKQVDLDKQDARRNPDALRKHIADLRRQADAITDPIEKKSALDRIKLLYDTTGKARGYEEQFPTVREARETRAMLDAVGGREGFQQMQATLSEVEQNTSMLKAGDPAIVDRMWQQAPEGTPKLIPAFVDKLEREKPQEFQQFMAPRSVKFLDQQGFPQAFDSMIRAYEAGKTEDAQAIRDQLIQWVAANRQQGQQQKQIDPEVERLRTELEQLKQGGEQQKNETALNAVIDHAGPAIDKVAKPIVGRYGLTGEEYTTFRQAVWKHLVDVRNEDPTYKTTAQYKIKQGHDQWVQYANRWTADNADASIRAVLKTPPWSRLQGTVKQTAAATQSPTAPNVQKGQQPEPSEIDYSPKGKMAAQKAGFKSLEDMLLAGQAPLKVGGIRKWR